MRKTRRIFFVRGGQKCQLRGGPKKLGWGDRPWLGKGGGGLPLDGYGPPIHTTTMILDSPSQIVCYTVQALARWLVVIGVSDNVLSYSFLNCH